MKLLYYSPASYGGIADYAHEQANALVEIGIDVDFLCTVDYPNHRITKYKRLDRLDEISTKTNFSSKLTKVWRYLRVIYINYKKLADTIEQGGYRYVLFASYSEYLAPLWAGQFRKLADKGVTFGAVVHDPVRDFVLGPMWWHRWSIAQGYSFLREAFVHDEIELDTVRPMNQLRTTVIPHGPYRFPEPSVSRIDMRSRLDLPADAKVMLAFGHLRPNKNLDLVIRAMVEVPDVYLVVAGKETSSSHPLAPVYKALAEEVEIGERIRWEIRFIPDHEVGNFFIASDLVLLTYSQNFRSASGVLNSAVQYRKQCLASGGECCLGSVVQRYNIGLWVVPDCKEAISSGLKQWLSLTLHPDWQAYECQNSWEKNAKLTLGALGKKCIPRH